MKPRRTAKPLTSVICMYLTLPPLDEENLPRGRWVTDIKSVENSYVHGRSAYHSELWSEWITLKDALRSVLGRLPAAWLSGSFFTTKPQPSDIDCVFIVDQRTFANVTTQQYQAFIELVATSQVRRYMKLRVDSFIIEWTPWEGTSPPLEYRPKLEQRGYWDEFWARVKDDDPKTAALPRRGYLEVIIDDYQR